MKRWVIADTHFGHTNIIDYCNRPFSSVEEMDEVIIDNWNSVVGEKDLVYHLGDFAFGKGSRERIADYRAKLNGQIFLFRGNHDRQTKTWYNRMGFDFVAGGDYWLYEPNILLSHKPYPIRKPMINIHGHTHNLMHLVESNLYYCVSVENINYTPIDLDELIRSLR